MNPSAPIFPSALPITIRPGYPEDQPALARLAALDSAERPPAAPLLVAETDGELRVALSLRDGSSIADPFVATAEILELLRLRAATEARTQPRRRRRSPRRYRLSYAHR
jgi:hypothetical protein